MRALLTRNISESSAAVQVFPLAASQQGGRYPEAPPLHATRGLPNFDVVRHTPLRAATLDGRILLFRRTGDLTGRYRLKDYGWSTVARNGLEIFDIPGDHLALLAEPGVGALAKKSAAAMRTTWSAAVVDHRNGLMSVV